MAKARLVGISGQVLQANLKPGAGAGEAVLQVAQLQQVQHSLVRSQRPQVLLDTQARRQVGRRYIGGQGQIAQPLAQLGGLLVANARHGLRSGAPPQQIEGFLRLEEVHPYRILAQVAGDVVQAGGI